MGVAVSGCAEKYEDVCVAGAVSVTEGAGCVEEYEAFACCVERYEAFAWSAAVEVCNNNGFNEFLDITN